MQRKLFVCLPYQGVVNGSEPVAHLSYVPQLSDGDVLEVTYRDGRISDVSQLLEDEEG